MSNSKNTDHSNKLDVKTPPESMEAVASSRSVNAPKVRRVAKSHENRRHPDGSTFEWSGEAALIMKTYYDLSFEEILGSLRKVDVIDSRDRLKEIRKYHIENRDVAKKRVDVNGRMQDFELYVLFEAKISVLNILLSDDTLRARQRIRAARLVKAAS